MCDNAPMPQFDPDTPTDPPPDPGPAEQTRHHAPPPIAEALVGCSIGNYRLLRLIGGGAMGDVYEASAPDRAKTCAIKVLRPGRKAGEAILLTAPSHPNILSLEAACTWTDPTGADRHYVVMEMVTDARTITAHADAAALDISARIDLITTLCSAIEHTQKLGVLHFDLKPDNILVDAHAVLKVADFGVAIERLQDPLARPGGTIDYMSPEQCERPVRDLTPASEVFSIGVILYELLTGRRPHTFPRNCSRKKAAETKRALAPPVTAFNHNADAELSAIVARALHPDPREGSRFQHPSELREALRTWSTRNALVRHGASRTLARLSPLAQYLAAVALIVTALLIAREPIARAAVRLDGQFFASIPPPPGAPAPQFREVRLVDLPSPADILALAEELGVEHVSQAPVTWRTLHARFCDLAAEAGARAVVFDIYFANDSPFDQTFAEAIDRAVESGTSVVLGVRDFTADPSGRPPFAQRLWDSRAHWGSLFVLETGPKALVPIAVQTADAEARPSLALAACAAARVPRSSATHQIGDQNVRTEIWTPSSRPGARTTIETFNTRPFAIDQYVPRPGVPDGGRLPGDREAYYEFPVPDEQACTNATLAYDDLCRMNADQRIAALYNKVLVIVDPRDPQVRVADDRTVRGSRVHAAAIEALLQEHTAFLTGFWLLIPLTLSAAVGLTLGNASVRLVTRRIHAHTSSYARLWLVSALPRSIALAIAAVVTLLILHRAASTFGMMVSPSPVVLALVLGAEAGTLLAMQKWLGLYKRGHQ